MRLVCLVIAILAAGSCTALRSGTAGARKAPLEALPERWIDLPEAPFFAALVGRKALLINRTNRSFDEVSAGCVREVDGRVSTLYPLLISHVYDGAWRPGEHVERLLWDVANFDATIAYRRKYLPGLAPLNNCPLDAHVAVIAASWRAEYVWTADGTAWPR